MDQMIFIKGHALSSTEVTNLYNSANGNTAIGLLGGLVVQAAAAMAKDDPERIAQLSITAWRAKRANNPARASFYLRPLISRTWLSFF